MKDLIREEKEKHYIDNSIYMELIGEIATQLTELNFHDNTFVDWANLDKTKENAIKFTDEAQEFYNERYDEVEALFNNLGGIYSKNKHEL